MISKQTIRRKSADVDRLGVSFQVGEKFHTTFSVWFYAHFHYCSLSKSTKEQINLNCGFLKFVLTTKGNYIPNIDLDIYELKVFRNLIIFMLA